MAIGYSRFAASGGCALRFVRRYVCGAQRLRAPDDGGKAVRPTVSRFGAEPRDPPVVGNPAGSPYGYRGEMGPSHWYKLNTAWRVSREGRRQSPVDLVDELAHRDPSLASIVYKYCHDLSARISNDGLLPMCHVTPKMHTLTGGPVFDQEHELTQYHFHFSSAEQPGSEHALNGKRYPAEVHFVHYKKSYGSFADALKHEDGLAVIGAVLDVAECMKHVTCLTFDADIRKMSHVKQVGKAHFTDLNLSKYNLGTSEYFVYDGSLTSPPCFECVHWIILKDPIVISKEAFQCLTELESAEGGLIANPGNYRPLQPLNSRRVRSTCHVHGDVCRGVH